MMRRLTAAALAALLIAGCESTADTEYRSAGSIPQLEVPPDLTTPKGDNRYVLPDESEKAATLSGYQAGQAQQAKVGDAGVLPRVADMHVARDGNERWLVVSNETPDKLWGPVKDFWQESGFLIKTELPEAGIMETDWAEKRANVPQGMGIRGMLSKYLGQTYDTAQRDKFRTRMERTADGKGTEIYISHRGMEEVLSNDTNGTTIWQPRSPDPGLEAEFLRRLMVRLGADQQVAKQQVAAAQTGTERAAINKGPDGIEQLAVYEPFDRAWRRVGLALDRVGFTVEDRDRSKGIYYVRYADPETEMRAKSNEQGFFSKLFSSSSTVKAEQYRVAVLDQKDSSSVQVLDKDGKRDASGTAHRILALLHEQLK